MSIMRINKEDDFLGREVFARNLIRIISNCGSFPKSNDNFSFVIGIDAGWGYGKTYFNSLLITYLNDNYEKYKIKTVYYDAWENDFWNNAFEPFFSEMIESELLKETVENRDIIEMAKTAATIIALGFKGVVLKKIDDSFDIGTADAIQSELGNIWNNAISSQYQTANYFKEFTSFKKAVELLKGYLVRCANQSQHKIVIFVDELDRCKPIFAIQTLEIVKHLFNVPNIVFVFSLDISQLSHCVKSVYGEGIDSIGYLERFFNYTTTLPKIDFSAILDRYLREFSIQVSSPILLQGIKNICSSFGLSIRDLRTILSSLYILQHTSISRYVNETNAQILYFYFLALKYKFPDIINSAVFRNNYTQLRNFISNNPVPFSSEMRVSTDFYIDIICSGNGVYSHVYTLVSNSVCLNNQLVCLKLSHNSSLSIFMSNDNKEVDINEVQCLSFLLYSPDFDALENTTMVEHIYKRLELCDCLYE